KPRRKTPRECPRLVPPIQKARLAILSYSWAPTLSLYPGGCHRFFACSPTVPTPELWVGDSSTLMVLKIRLGEWSFEMARLSGWEATKLTPALQHMDICARLMSVRVRFLRRRVHY